MKTFEVTITKNWVEQILDYRAANNHNEVLELLPLKAHRIKNERFREIEKTGTYYRITDMSKGGKSFIFEINHADN